MIDKINSMQVLGVQHLGKVTSEKINALIGYQKPITLVDSSEGVRWNLRNGYNAKVTLEGNRTLVLQELTPGDYGTLEIIQDGVGSRTLTLPSGSKVSNAGAGVITLSTAIDSIDIATFYYNGTTLFWNLSTDFT